MNEFDLEAAKAAKAEVFDSTDKFLAAGERWLSSLGYVSNLTHNALLLKFYTIFPRVKSVEYYLNQEECWLELHLKFPWSYRLFTKKSNLLAELTTKAETVVKDHLPGYQTIVVLD